jgi:hypothetical protein
MLFGCVKEFWRKNVTEGKEKRKNVILKKRGR